MELFDSIDENCIVNSLAATSKEDVLKELTDAAVKTGKINDVEAALSALAEREALGSTGVGEQVAIPHAKLSDIEDIIITVGISRAGVDFQSGDNVPVKLFFMLFSPEKQLNQHLKTLARISRLVKLTGFKSRVLAGEISAAQIRAVLREEEAKLG